MDTAQDAFFAVIGEGAALLKNLDENSPGFFDDLNRLREILSILGYESAVKPLPFSLEDKEGSAKALWDYLGAGINALPDELAVFEAETVTHLARLTDNRTLVNAAGEWAFDNRKKHSTIQDSTKLAVFQNLAARGLSKKFDRNALLEASEAGEALLAKGINDYPEYVSARAEYDRLSVERSRKLRDVNAALMSLDLTRDEREALRAERQALADDSAATDAWEGVKSAQEQINKERASGYKALFEDKGQKIIDTVLAASPVSEAEASAWAAEQVIDDNAKAKLKRMGYKPDDVIRDMAEFYRLSGGKASAIRIGLDGGRRANASGIETRTGEKVINLGAHFNKTVLFHELAHHLENDPIAKAASNGFLIKRRESETRYSLRSLSGNKGYRSDEAAYKDSFMDTYIGKIYRDGITEVFSMGVQYLASPKDAAIFAGKDPEMFDLITGYLTMPTTPAMHATLNLHKSATGQRQEARQSEEAQYAQALEWLSAKAPIAKDDWFDALDRNGEHYDLLATWILTKDRKGGALQYVGSNGQYKVFSGAFRNPNTKRNSKGYLVVDMALEGDEPGRRRIPDSRPIHGGMEEVSAFIALVQLNGVSLDRVYYDYFMDSRYSNRKKKLIETVGPENLK